MTKRLLAIIIGIMIKAILHVKNDCYLAFKYLSHSQASYKAMALAFATLLTIVPLITVIIYCYTTYFAYMHVDALVNDFVTNNFLPHTNVTITNYLQTFSERAFRLSIFNILFFFISAIWLVITIKEVMLSIWHGSHKPFNLFSLLVYTFIVLIIPLLILIIALLSYALTFVISQIFTWKLLLILVPLILNTLIFSLLYILTAKIHYLKWHHALYGGFIAAVLLEFSKSIFTLYINYFSNYEIIYGTLSILTVFVLWVYIFWLITLYGALIVKIKYIHNEPM